MGPHEARAEKYWSIQTKFKQIRRILRGLRNYEKKGLKEKDQHAGGLDSLD